MDKPYCDKIDVVNYITAPEIEILIIIGENKYNGFLKVKSSMKPRFCKHRLGIKKPDFIYEYFHDASVFVEVLKKYKSV